MTVKIIGQQEPVQYSLEVRRVVIQFLDGTQMVGSINIHAKFAGTERLDDEYETYQMPSEAKLRFRRTSDYLRHCSENDGMITVFDASYAGYDNKVCFVFLHSIKFISEEKEMRKIPEERPEPADEETPGTGFSLRDRLRKGR